MDHRPDTSTDWVAHLQRSATTLRERGITAIESFAWRDLADPDAGGSEVHADEVLARWANAGITIHHRTSTDASTQHLTRRGYRITRAGGRYGVFPRVICRKLFTRAKRDTAVVEIWNGVPWFSQLWGHRQRMVWLHHIHEDMWKDSVPAPLAPIARFIEVRLAPWFYRRTTIATLAHTTRDELVARGFDPAKVIVAEPGIDPRFVPADTEHRTATASLVAVGRLAPVKRFDSLIRVFAEVADQIPEAHLTIAGDGPDRASLRQLIDDLGLVDRITLAGRVDDEELLRLYRTSWLLVSASHSEGWGMTITEAAACGTPCVVTRNHGHEAATEHDVSGIIVDDVDDLATAIVSVVTDQNLRHRLGDGALRRAQLFQWDRTAALLLSVLANLRTRDR